MARTLVDSSKDRLAKLADKGDEKPKLRVAKRAPDLEPLNTRQPGELLMEMRVYCARHRMNIQTFIREAIEARLRVE